MALGGNQPFSDWSHCLLRRDFSKSSQNLLFGELISPRKNLLRCSCIAIAFNCFQNINAYTHRQTLFSSLVWEIFFRVKSSECREPLAEQKRLYSLKYFTLPSKAQGISQKISRKDVRARRQGECDTEVSSGCYSAISIMNSQLWLPIRSLFKTGTVDSLSWMGEGLMGLYLSCWTGGYQRILKWSQEEVYLQMWTPWGEAHRVPLDCSIPIITQMPWGQLSGSQNKTKSWTQERDL